jgi:anti-sigma B factor antagonist
MPPESFRMEVAQQGARVEVALWGELDAYSAHRLGEGMADLGELAGRHVVLDLAGIAFVDSAGLAAIVAALRDVRAADAAVTVRAMTPQVHKLFEITGLARLFPVEPGAGPVPQRRSP